MLRRANHMITSTLKQVEQYSCRGLSCYRALNRDIRNVDRYKCHPCSNICTLVSKSYKPPICFVPFDSMAQLYQPKLNIFTDSFLEIDTFQETCKRQKLQVRDGYSLRVRLHKCFTNSGIQKIFADDLENLIYVAMDESHLQFIADIILAFMADKHRLLASEKKRIFSLFISQCKVLNAKDLAQVIWQDKSMEMYKSKVAHMKYYMMLYEHEEYHAIVQDFENHHTANPNQRDRISILVLAALCRMGTDDALSKMPKIINLDKEEEFLESGKDFGRYLSQAKSRSLFIHAFLALKLKKYGLSYDILRHPDITDSIAVNIKVSILTELGRINEALLLLQTHLELYDNSAHKFEREKENENPKKYGKIKIVYDVMKRLTEAVKDENNAELSKDLVSICHDLDSKAKLLNGSLEDIVLTPINSSQNLSRRERALISNKTPYPYIRE